MDALPCIKDDSKYQGKLLELASKNDIPSEWRNTPIESFIMAQNFGMPIAGSDSPQMLIVTCIEFRYSLPIPRMYAYVIRRASGRLLGSEFSVGYVLSKGVQHIALVGHNDCGMAKVAESAPYVVQAFTNQGWSPDLAKEYVRHYAERHAIPDELSALEAEYDRVRHLFPKVTIAPLFVSLFDSKLYLPKFYKDSADNFQLYGSYSVPDDEVRKLMR